MAATPFTEAVGSVTGIPGAPSPMPRLISPTELREYLGVTPSALARLRRAGTIPGPVRGSRSYDFEAVKRALDNPTANGIQLASDEDELIARAKKWRKSA